METTKVVVSRQDQPPQKKKIKFNLTPQKVVFWLKTHPLDTSLIVLILLGVILTLNPLPNIDGVDRWIEMLPPAMRSNTIHSVHWVAHEGGAQFSGTVFFVIGTAVALWRLRSRVVSSKRMWSTRCPDCHEEHTLKRIHRTGKDKFLNRLLIPTRRYQCNLCHWQGLRIDENLV